MFNAMKMVNQKALRNASQVVEPDNPMNTPEKKNSEINLKAPDAIGQYNTYGTPTKTAPAPPMFGPQNLVNMPDTLKQADANIAQTTAENDQAQMMDSINAFNADEGEGGAAASTNKALGSSSVSATLGASPLAMVGAGFGILNGVLDNNKKNEELRRREIEVEQSIAQNASERDKINNMNPNANFRAKMGMMQDAKSGMAQQAANVGGASVANSGLGGDVGSAKIAAMKASAPMAQATAGFDQQMAGAVDQKTQEENQQLSQLSNNTGQRAQLSQMTDYINTEKSKNPLGGILSAALTGATGFNMLDTMRSKTISDTVTPSQKKQVQKAGA